MRYRRIKAFLHVLVLLYIGVALVMGLYAFHREVFPVFSWSLFSTVAERETDFAIQVLGIDGEALEPPVDFMTSKDMFAGAGDIRAYYTIQNLGIASLRRRGDDIQRIRATFEQTYLGMPGSSVEYAVLMRVFDPVERWQEGRIESWRPVARYRVDGETP